LSGPVAKIHLKPDAVPYARHTPYPVPHHWKAEVKASLDRDVKRGIITPVPIGMPVTWCSPMVVVCKADGSPRRTIDFQKLNSQTLRETHHTPPPFLLASQIPPGTKKSVFDAVDGYHSVELDPESQPLTMFITEWGRYMYKRMPQGFSAAGDAYTRRSDEILEPIKSKVKIVDDTLIYDDTVEEHFYHVWDFLTVCATHGIVVNKKKFRFCRDTIDFAGLTITPEGVAPSEKMLAAITDFPCPTNITSARSWFGLVNQVAWAYALGPVMAPFRDLIKPNQKFYWDNALDIAFEKSKVVIVDLVRTGVKSFDMKRTTCIQPDWCKDGIGYLLLQKYCKCTEISPLCCAEGWKLIFAGSRFTKVAEQNYSPTEGEALAVSWALQHSRLFTLGCQNLFVASDHKPLLGIFNDRDLGSINNPRTQNLKESTLPWRFTMLHCPGKWTRGADALSRNPGTIAAALASLSEAEPLGQTEDFADTLMMASISALSNLSSVTLDDVTKAAHEDHNYQDLINIILTGFPNKRSLVAAHLREYWEVRHRLSTFQGIVLLDKRLVIPQTLRKVVLDNLHAANQGVSGMKFRANRCVYWPGLDRCIKNYRDNCLDCTKHAPSHPPEPLILTKSPEYPFQQICSDYFEIGSHAYLTIVDRFSAWICVYALKAHEVNGKTLVNIFRNLFVAYGVSEELSSDGDPKYMCSEFQNFLHVWGVKHHRVSSVAYPQSNGRAELGVKTSKRIIRNNVDANGSLNTDRAARAMLQYRNTPLPDLMLSPAQILLHRQLRDGIPSHPHHYHLHREWIISAKDREASFGKRNQALLSRYNARARQLEPLLLGSKVLLQGKDKKWALGGCIVEVLPNRQYRVKMFHSGRTTLRNRRFLRQMPPTAVTDPQFIPSAGNCARIPNETVPCAADNLVTVPVPLPDPQTSSTTVLDNLMTAPRPDSQTPDMTDDEVTGSKPMGRKIMPRALKNLLPFNKPGLKE